MSLARSIRRPRRQAALVTAALAFILAAIALVTATPGSRVAAAGTEGSWATLAAIESPQWGPGWDNATGEPDGVAASRDVDGEGPLRLHGFPLDIPEGAAVTDITFTIHAQTSFEGVDGDPNPACFGLPSASVSPNVQVPVFWSPVEPFAAPAGPGFAAYSISGPDSGVGPWGDSWEPADFTFPLFGVDIFVQPASEEDCDQQGMQFEVDAVYVEVTYAMPVELIVTNLLDLDGDGTPALPGVGLGGWRFDIYSSVGSGPAGDIASGTTGGEGTLTATLPAPGAYTVCQTPEDGWTNTSIGGDAASDPAGDGRPCASVELIAGEEGPLNSTFTATPPVRELRVCKIFQHAGGALLTDADDGTSGFPAANFALPLQGPYDYGATLDIPQLPYQETVSVDPVAGVRVGCVTEVLPEGDYTYGDETGAGNDDWQPARFHEVSTGGATMLASYCEHGSGPAICDGTIELTVDTTLYILNQPIEQDPPETPTATVTQETPTQETPTQETPTQETPTQQTPTQETPTQQSPTQPTSTAQTPTQAVQTPIVTPTPPTQTAVATQGPPTQTPTPMPPTTPGPDTWGYTLYFRWNNLSWQSPAMPIEDALRGEGANEGGSNVFDQVIAILLWDAASQQWLAFYPAGIGQPGANDFETLEPGHAYWIAIAGPGPITWNVTELAAGGDE